MADAAGLLAYALVFVIGFIAGKLFAALQFAGFKSASRASKSDNHARKSVDRLLRIGRQL